MVMDRTDEVVSLLAAVKRGYNGDILPVLTALADEEAASRGFSDEALVYAHLAMFSGDPRHLRPAVTLASKLRRHAMLARLTRTAEAFKVDRPVQESVRQGRAVDVDERFLEHCRKNGITVLRQLQVGIEGRESCRSVFMTLDSDGLVKVFKELRRPETSRLGLIASEQKLYEHLGRTPGLPPYYGTTEIDAELSFLRLGACYGHTLDNFVDPNDPLSPEEAGYIVWRLADTLSRLHAAGVVYNDMRLSNIKVEGDEVYLLDLGDAQFLGKDGDVTTYVHGPEHVAPEVVLRHESQPASDVFQLGIIWHQLLTGQHPFSDGLPAEHDPELLRLRDCLANVMLTPKIDNKNTLLARMLEQHAPQWRPSAADVAKALTRPHEPTRTRKQSVRPAESNGTVLLPARIGIPHTGHINFMARLLEIGYDLVVSFSASYVQTSLDPLPKWTVLKMVGHALRLRGFDMSRVRFLCTPLFDDDEQIRLHYTLMPGVEKVVALASGNPDVREFFRGLWPILDQRALFGFEGSGYELRSWGERLRNAVRHGDKATFDDLIAPGAEEIMSFEEMRDFCSRPFLDFAWGPNRGRAVAVLRDAEGKEIVRQRISTYSTPEDTLVQALGAVFVDRFSKVSTIRIGTRGVGLAFEDTALEGQNLAIRYWLEEAA